MIRWKIKQMMIMTKQRILIIEDERGLTDVLSYNLNREGYDIHLALLSPRDLRLALKTTPAGRTLERAKADAVAALLRDE